MNKKPPHIPKKMWTAAKGLLHTTNSSEPCGDTDKQARSEYLKRLEILLAGQYSIDAKPTWEKLDEYLDIQGWRIFIDFLVSLKKDYPSVCRKGNEQKNIREILTECDSGLAEIIDDAEQLADKINSYIKGCIDCGIGCPPELQRVSDLINYTDKERFGSCWAWYSGRLAETYNNPRPPDTFDSGDDGSEISYLLKTISIIASSHQSEGGHRQHLIPTLKAAIDGNITTAEYVRYFLATWDNYLHKSISNFDVNSSAYMGLKDIVSSGPTHISRFLSAALSQHLTTSVVNTARGLK